MQIDIENEGIRLLDWLYSQQDTRLMYDVSEYVKDHGFPDDSARLLVEHLRRHGLIKGDVAISGQADAMITPQGISQIQRIRARRSDPAARARLLHSAMLKWLFAHERSERTAEIMDWSGFASSASVDLFDNQLDIDEVENEAEYLANKNLIAGRDVEQKPRGSLWPKLTSAGRDCVMDFEGDVANYIQGQRGSMTNHINVTGNKGNFMIASNNSQQNITTSIDTDALVKFATAIRDSMQIFTLPEDQERQLREQALELDELTKLPNPSNGRMKQLVEALMGGLAKVASPVAAAIATSLGNDALRALGH